ncbi:MAG: peptide-methionine (S)-S-oxide reductase MsrA [Burkholderiaceae bacterium]
MNILNWKNLSSLAGVSLCIAIAACGVAGAEGQSARLPDPKVDDALVAGPPRTAVFSGGCFWGVQAVFEHVNGVVSATSGYSGGTVKNPTYEAVSTGTTGHAESVQVVYDPAKISYGQLLKIFFSVAHDPTQLNRQGPDTGTQYRSAVFTSSPEQEHIAHAYVEQLTAAKVYGSAIVTQIAPLSAFYPAEAYHQDYAKLHPENPYIVINDLPKVANLKSEFPSLYRSY